MTDPVRIAVIGVGLIGGSVGHAARSHGATVVGWDPDASVTARACELGALDEAAPSLDSAVVGAGAVVVAAPVGALPGAVGEALAAADEDTVVTDVGSTKRAVVAACGADPRFVGGHPLAGAETAGVEHARADLFADATWYLTPTERTSGMLFERLHRLLTSWGARPRAVEAERHDAVLATVSHLPHVLANVLVSAAAQTLASEGEPLPATGPSFRDATRVAGANTTMWRDIYVSNADALGTILDDVLARLGAVRDLLAARDDGGIAAWNDEAAGDRRRLLEAGLAGGPVHELRASVPNRPGVIAELALALGHAGVNITDMALYPADDMRTGRVALFIAGDEPARRAEELVAGLGFPVARP
ncbi:MAG TPA: prephenate dehydrogenase/arogenate dehydrogenase family protein [Solirubrobacteraceae bacterium]